MTAEEVAQQAAAWAKYLRIAARMYARCRERGHCWEEHECDVQECGWCESPRSLAAFERQLHPLPEDTNEAITV